MAAAALAFDLDGTVWDSYPSYAGILGDLGKSNAVPILLELSRDGNVVHLMHRLGISRPAFLAECRRRAKAMLYAGVHETLEQLCADGIPLGAASSLPGDIVATMLDGADLASFFTSVVHRGNCRSTKPHPRPVLQCLEGMGVAPSLSVYYVGDRDVDQAAARAAKITFAWAAYGYGDGLILRPAEPRLDDFREILDL